MNAHLFLLVLVAACSQKSDIVLPSCESSSSVEVPAGTSLADGSTVEAVLAAMNADSPLPVTFVSDAGSWDDTLEVEWTLQSPPRLEVLTGISPNGASCPVGEVLRASVDLELSTASGLEGVAESEVYANGGMLYELVVASGGDARLLRSVGVWAPVVEPWDVRASEACADSFAGAEDVDALSISFAAGPVHAHQGHIDASGTAASGNGTVSAAMGTWQAR